MTIDNAQSWATANGYLDTDTDTSREFRAWTDDGSVGVSVYESPYWTPDDDYGHQRFVAILLWRNGEQRGGRRGHGPTMLAALRDL